MSEKLDSASYPDEEANKKIKFDIPSSSGWEWESRSSRWESTSCEWGSSATQEVRSKEGASVQGPESSVKQGDISEGVRGASVPGESLVGDNLSPSTENTPRNQDDTAPAGSPSHSGASASTSIVYNKRILRYKKSLTQGDISRGELMIPILYGRKFLPEPQEHDGIYEDIKVAFMDHKRQVWPMEAYFSERTSSYMLGLNWDRYVKKFKLEPEDMIFFYHDPALPTYDHYLMEFEKKGRDSNPTEKPSDPTEKPSDPKEKPSDPTEKPRDPTEKPSDPKEKPSDPTEKPSDPTEKPSDPKEEPSDPTEKPSDPKEKPSNPKEKPSNPKEKPIDPTDKPSDPKDTT
ncbi:hypothetical protein AAG906_012815 [Vitis piasezkii]